MSDRVRTAAALALVAGAVLAAGEAHGQSWRTVNSSRQLQDREPLAVQIEYGAGELRLAPSEGALLYAMEMRYDEEQFAPVARYDAGRRSLKLGMESRQGGGNVRNVRGGSRADIQLSREVPLALDLDFGAGDAEIDLGGVALQRLDLSTGASKTTVRFGERNPVAAERIEINAGAAELRVYGLGNTRANRLRFQGGIGSTLLDFSGPWDRSATASVQMGMGSLVLRLPRELGVRVQKSSFLTSFDAAGLVKRDGGYYSRNWETAAHQLTIDLDAAFGSIDIQWVD